MQRASRANLAVGACAGLFAGIATAAADFGAHWLFMDGAGDRVWLGLRLLSLQAAAGVVFGVGVGLAGATTAILAGRISRWASTTRGPRRVWPTTVVQAGLLGLLTTPATTLTARLLWSGGMMSRLPYKPQLVVLTACVLALAASLGFFLALRCIRQARSASRKVARSVVMLLLGAAFASGKVNQWVLPNLYDYLHTTLSLATFALYATAASFVALRVGSGSGERPARLSFAAASLSLTVIGAGYASLRTLDHNQNVRVALLSANMPNSRALMLATAPLLPRIESTHADLAKQRAAAARARRARVEEDPGLPQLPDAHVLLITVDALRADHLGLYGYARNTSPQLDEIGRRAQVFERAYAQAPHSSYSLCSMLTSEYLHETTELGARPPEQTLPRMLQDDGYHTAAFYTQGIFHTAAERLGVYEQDAFGFALHDHQDRPPEQMTDRVLAEIDRTIERGEPSALFWVHYFNVHEPYEATSLGTSDVDRYDSEIIAADAAIGRLVRTARQRLTKPLIVVVTADHGEEFHEHGGVYHGSSLYEEQVRVPLLVDVPGLAPRRYVQPVESVDIVPTVLGLLGLPRPATLRGTDLRAVLAHPERERGPVFSAVIHKKMVVQWPHKLVADLRFGAYELYNLQSDPAERQNNADRDPTRLRELRAEIYAWLDSLSGSPPDDGRDDGRSEHQQALEWGRLGDRRAVEPLQALLLDDDASPAARSEAAQLLGKLADPQAASSLLAATRTQQRWVAAEAAIALGRMFDPRARAALQRLVTSEDPGIRSRAAVSLARLRDPGAVPALIEALWLAPNPYEREEAVRWLGRLGDESALEPLLNLLPETHTRHLVVLALGDLGDARAFDPLVQTLGWDRNTNVRDGVVRALAVLGDPRALTVLLPLVEQDSALRNTGEALVRLGALERGLIGGTDFDRRLSRRSTGLAACHQGPLRHDWDFLQRTYCKTTRTRVSFPLQVPQQVFEAGDESLLLISLRRLDSSASTALTLQVGQQVLPITIDGAWSEQRFALPAQSLPTGPVRAELRIPRAGARIALDHVLIVPNVPPTTLAAQQPQQGG